MSERTTDQEHGFRPAPSRWRWLVGGLLPVVAVVGLAVWASQRSGPSHEGRPLDDYLADLARPPSSGSYQIASNAVIALGTNSLPVLLRNIRQPAPPHIRWFIRYQTNLPAGWRKSLHSKLDPYRYLNRQPGALNAVTLLGTNAAPLAEDLVRLFGQEPRGDHSLAQVLPRLGPATLPHLKPFLQHTNLRVRALATFVVHELGPAGVEAAPELVAGLRGADENQQRLVVQTLARMGPGAMPTVTNLLTSAEVIDRLTGVQALAGVLPRARELSPTIIRLLNDPAPSVRLSVALLIVDWWPVFDAATQERIATLGADHPWRRQYQESLELLAGCRDQLFQVLREALWEHSPAERLEAATRLHHFFGSDDEVIASLQELANQFQPGTLQRSQVDALLRPVNRFQSIPARPQTIPHPGMVPAVQSPP